MQQKPLYIPGLPYYLIGKTNKQTLPCILKAFLSKYNTDFSPVKVSENGMLTTSSRCNFKRVPGFRDFTEMN